MATLEFSELTIFALSRHKLGQRLCAVDGAKLTYTVLMNKEDSSYYPLKIDYSEWKLHLAN